MKIVLDTNVVYAGLYSSRGASYQILRYIEQGIVTISLSTALLFEYEEILKRSRATLKLTVREIEQLLDYFCHVSEHHKIFFLWRPYLKDPKDDHILELAVSSQTETIVTHNMKDFRDIRRFGVRAITPKTLMEELA
ncbi:putative toxin-antitoxin system toxin component, PIN family [Nitrospira sp. M1]